MVTTTVKSKENLAVIGTNYLPEVDYQHLEHRLVDASVSKKLLKKPNRWWDSYNLCDKKYMFRIVAISIKCYKILIKFTII